jgi:hypothetical protein
MPLRLGLAAIACMPAYSMLAAYSSMLATYSMPAC